MRIVAACTKFLSGGLLAICIPQGFLVLEAVCLSIILIQAFDDVVTLDKPLLSRNEVILDPNSLVDSSVRLTSKCVICHLAVSTFDHAV